MSVGLGLRSGETRETPVAVETEAAMMKSILRVSHHFCFARLLGLGYLAAGDEDRPPRSDPKPQSEIVGYEWFNSGPDAAPPAEKLAMVNDFLRLQESHDGN